MKTKTKIKKKIVKSIKTGLGLTKKPPKRKNFTKEIKEARLRFQKYRCNTNRCNFPRSSWRYLEFDHVKGRDDFSLGNCQALCPFHHREKTKRDQRLKRIEKGLAEKKKTVVKKSIKKPPVRKTTRITTVRRTRTK